jgi:hypothetical protein
MKPEDFWNHYEENSESGCLNWTKGKSKAGYGQVNINGKIEYCHRISFQLTKGEIPDGMHVCHS